MNKQTKILLVLLAAISCISPLVRPALAQTADERQYLLMYFKEEELVVETPTRSSKPVSQTAENVTVITAGDIQLMDAHTLADVLNTVTGVQVFLTGGPGSSATAFIQGSGSRHVAVFLDGIPLNNLSDNAAEIGSVPVQAIEKIEIIKGPASSAWGSALGGVINIITKTGRENGTHGMVSASYGQHHTGDYRAEVSGKKAGVGYYFTAGRLETDGFRPNNEFAGDNGYAKLSYDVTDKTSVVATMSYDKLERGIGDLPAFGIYVSNNMKTLRSTLSVRSLLSEHADLQITAWHMRQHNDFSNRAIASDAELSADHYLDDGYGGSMKLTWKISHHAMVIGGDYDSRTLESNTIADNKQGIEKTAAFVNDTIAYGPVTVTPGLRFDRTDTNGNFTSPSLGMTYQVTETSLLRAYAARGFSVPALAGTYGDNLFHVSNPDLNMEKVKSYQVGFETAAVRYLWAKISLFRHDVDDVLENVALTPVTFITVNSGKERREGMEVELRTAPVMHTSLSAGASFINAKDRETGERIKSVAQRTYDIGLQYDGHSFKALVKGHYIYWNTDPVFEGKYDDFIIDAHAAKTLFEKNDQKLEIYGDVHNLLDDAQYAINIYPNPGRWFEGGVRYLF